MLGGIFQLDASATRGSDPTLEAALGASSSGEELVCAGSEGATLLKSTLKVKPAWFVDAAAPAPDADARDGAGAAADATALRKSILNAEPSSSPSIACNEKRHSKILSETGNAIAISRHDCCVRCSRTRIDRSNIEHSSGRHSYKLRCDM